MRVRYHFEGHVDVEVEEPPTVASVADGWLKASQEKVAGAARFTALSTPREGGSAGLERAAEALIRASEAAARKL